MIKRVLFLVFLFALGMLSANMTLGNSGKDCKNIMPCPGNSCGKEHGHFSRCTEQLPTLTIPTVTIPTVTIPTLPIPTTTTTNEPDPTTSTTPEESTTTVPTKPTTTTQPDKAEPQHCNCPSPILPPNAPITSIKNADTENVLRTVGTNFASSIVGLIVGVLGAWLWCTRIKK